MQMIKNKLDFKKENQIAWEHNTDYWLHNPLRQVEDTKIFFKKKLAELVIPNMAIIDMGCGSGWLLDFLLELNVPFTYLGLDFNKKFIDYLREKYSDISFASFDFVDFEEPIDKKYFSSADVVFNCFNFFETANLENAFENAAQMLKPSGKLIIFTIEVTYLILAVSSSMEEFKVKLKNYEEIKSKGEVPYFFQNIDMGDSESKELKYASVLYSLDDYYKHAKKFNMRIADFGEVIKTSKYLPKVYQYIAFAK